MPALLFISDKLNYLVQSVARFANWFFIGMIITICVDVVTRKFGLQIPHLNSTRLQELEWHFHTGLFALWLGYAYVINQHVRIDIATMHLSLRKRAWIELIGCFLFAIPYALVVTYFGIDFTYTSFMQNEISDAGNGLPYRWIVKSLLAVGMIVLLLAIVAKILRLIVYLFAAQDLREHAVPFGGKE